MTLIAKLLKPNGFDRFKGLKTDSLLNLDLIKNATEPHQRMQHHKQRKL